VRNASGSAGPIAAYIEPAGIPPYELKEIELPAGELEAAHLSDNEGLLDILPV